MDNRLPKFQTVRKTMTDNDTFLAYLRQVLIFRNLKFKLVYIAVIL